LLKNTIIEIIKILVDISMIQDDDIGDGTTSVVILAGALLKESEKLFEQKLHTMIIVAGFREASCKKNQNELVNSEYSIQLIRLMKLPISN